MADLFPNHLEFRPANGAAAAPAHHQHLIRTHPQSWMNLRKGPGLGQPDERSHPSLCTAAFRYQGQMTPKVVLDMTARLWRMGTMAQGFQVEAQRDGRRESQGQNSLWCYGLQGHSLPAEDPARLLRPRRQQNCHL